MAVLILIALWFVCIGGQIAILVTDFVQSIFCNIVFVILIVILFVKFDWSQISEALLTRPEGKSMINPFDITGLQHYDLWFYLYAVFGVVYGVLSWQGMQGYETSAKSAHDARMAKILGYLRFLTPIVVFIFVPICVFTMLNHPDFAQQSHSIRAVMDTIENPQIRSQFVAPIALSQLLPAGIMGLFVAVMFSAFITTHDTYLHSWGSILLQDIIMPFRKKPFTQRQHLLYLKLSISGIAVFIWFFSYYFVQKVDIMMFFSLTGMIFAGCAGSLIVGGLYTKRGTAAAAWATMIWNLVYSGIAFTALHYWPQTADFLMKHIPFLWKALEVVIPDMTGENLTLTAADLGIWQSISCILIYIMVSLLTFKKPFDLDRMLHRGKYAVEGDESVEDEVGIAKWKKVLGLDKNIPFDDKVIMFVGYSYVGLSMLMVGGGGIYHLVIGISNAGWLKLWHCYIWFSAVYLVAVATWFGIAGFFDMKKMFAMLKIAKQDSRDDGTVINHHNLGDEKNQ